MLESIEFDQPPEPPPRRVASWAAAVRRARLGELQRDALRRTRISEAELLGAFVNFVVLAPIMIQAGDIAPRIAPSGPVVPLSRTEIVNQWALWWGVTIMVVGSLVSLAARPEIFTAAWRSLRRRG